MQAASGIGDAFYLRAGELASSYKKELLPLLQKEKTLISDQLRRLDELSLSSLHPGAVKGEARRILQSVSRDRRMRAYRSLASRMARYRDQARQEFVELHQTRRSLAEEAGFASFFDYTLSRTGLSGETRSSVTVFRRLVEEDLAPLSLPIRRLQWNRLAITDPKPWDLLYPASFGLPALDPSAFPLEETYLEALGYLFSSKIPLFETMKEEGRLSFHLGAESRGDSFVLDPCARGPRDGLLSFHFPSINRSCLLLPQLPQEWFAAWVFAETGSVLLDQSSEDTLPCPLERAEDELIGAVARSSMSLLSQRTWGLFYGRMSRYAQEYHLTGLALDLPLICALDEMEEFLSRARVTNLDVFRHAWNEIARRYLLPGTDEELPALIPADDLWLWSPLLWNRPLTGIFDALGAVTVLGTLPLGRRHQLLETSFGRLLEQNEVHDPWIRLAEAGYPSPLEEETVRKASFALVDYLGL